MCFVKSSIEWLKITYAYSQSALLSVDESRSEFFISRFSQDYKHVVHKVWGVSYIIKFLAGK